MAGKRILMVFTSHAVLGDTGKQTGWYLPEGAHPYDVFRESGADITLASIQGGVAPLDLGSLEASKEDASCMKFHEGKLWEKTTKLSDISSEDFDAVFFVGGTGTMWDFPDNTEVQRVIREVYEQGGVVSAVCHGPVCFVNAKLSDGSLLVKDKEVTAFTNEEEDAVQGRNVVPYTCEDKLASVGAKYTKAGVFSPHVAVAGRVITGQNPPSAHPTAQAVVDALKA